MSQKKFEYPWAIVSLDKRLFGISAEFVKTMVLVPNIVAVPNTPNYVRGVINLRGKVLNLVDLRARLGMKSYLEEMEDFCALMIQREEDHKKWLAKLESDVKENKDISVQTNPHLCAFGKWYDNYKAFNSVLARLLKLFDAPHQRIHAIAIDVTNLMKEGKQSEAQNVIDNCRNGDLAVMIKLFANVRSHIREDKREIAVVVEGDSGEFAVAVDSVESVEALKEDSIEKMERAGIKSEEKDLISLIGKREKTDEFVLILDRNEIIGKKYIEEVMANS